MVGKRLATSILILLALVATASAADFSADVLPGQASACPADTLLYALTVKNTGASADAYTVSLASDAAKWSVAAPAGFTLKSGKSQQIYIYTTPPISASPGTYNLDVLVTGQTNKQTYSAKVIVSNCHSVQLSTAAQGKESCANTPVHFVVSMQNTGRYTENFGIALTGLGAKYATLSQNEMQLTSKEQKDVTVTINTDKTAIGGYPVTLIARAKTSNALASQTLQCSSQSCYNYDLALDKNYLSFCEASEAKIPATITNRGEKDDTYDLKLTGPDWASLETTNLQAEAGRTVNTDIVLFPKFGIAGSFKASLTAISKDSGAEKSESMDINVLQCHATDLKLSTNYDSVCPYTTKAYTISLTNTGKEAERYAISVVGPDYVSIDKNFVTLDTRQQTTLNLIVAPKAETTGLKTIKIIAESQDPSRTSASATLNLNIAPQSSCFGVKTELGLSQVTVARGEGALIPVVVENIGSQSSTYALEISGSGASLAQLNPGTVTLNGNEAQTLHLYVSAPLETQLQEYKLTISARMEDGTVSSSSPLTIRIVEKSEKREESTSQPAQPTSTATTNTTPIQLTGLNNFFERLRTRLQASIRGLSDIQLPEIKTPVTQPTETQATNVTTPDTKLETTVRNETPIIISTQKPAASVEEVTQEVQKVFAKSDAIRTAVRSNVYAAKQAVAGIASVSDARQAVSYLFWYMKQRYQGVPYVVYYGAGLAVLGFLIGLGIGWPRGGHAQPRAEVTKPTAPAPTKPQSQKGIWQKFVDFLEEDDEDLEKPKLN